MNFELLVRVRGWETADIAGRTWHGPAHLPVMDEPTCAICGKPITEQDDADNNYCETANGEYHVDCYNAYEDDAPNRAADFYFDTAGDR